MLKLVRNALGDGLVLFDEAGNKIMWNFIERLEELKKIEGLRLANKLRATHINWRQQKMKVNLVAQALSASVANAIEYVNKVLNM